MQQYNHAERIHVLLLYPSCIQAGAFINIKAAGVFLHFNPPRCHSQTLRNIYIPSSLLLNSNISAAPHFYLYIF